MFSPGNGCFGRNREENLTTSQYKDKFIGNTFVRCAICKEPSTILQKCL